MCFDPFWSQNKQHIVFRVVTSNAGHAHVQCGDLRMLSIAVPLAWSVLIPCGVKRLHVCETNYWPTANSSDSHLWISVDLSCGGFQASRNEVQQRRLSNSVGTHDRKPALQVQTKVQVPER